MNAIHLKKVTAVATLYPQGGGLLTQLKLTNPRNGQGIDILWSNTEVLEPTSKFADWPGYGAPILFPLAGRQWLDESNLGMRRGPKTYPMPLHGFAYLLPWQVVSHKNDQSCTLRLSSSSASAVYFPYEFTFDCTYHLEKQSLRIDFELTYLRPLDPLPSSDLMPFAPGWHPFFRRSGGQTKYEKIHIPAKVYHRVTPRGTAGKGEVRIEPTTEYSPHSSELASAIFSERHGPIIWKNFHNQAVNLIIETSARFSIIVTYGKVTDPFLCIEPWFSLPDAFNEKSPMIWLEPGSTLRDYCLISLEAYSEIGA